jgi:hypothetical protein
MISEANNMAILSYLQSHWAVVVARSVGRRKPNISSVATPDPVEIFEVSSGHGAKNRKLRSFYCE